MKEHPRITAAEIHRTLLSDGHIHIGQVDPQLFGILCKKLCLAHVK